MLRTVLVAAFLAAGVGVATAPIASAGPYDTCKEAADDGLFNIPAGDDNYDVVLDRDGDGIACQS